MLKYNLLFFSEITAMEVLNIFPSPQARRTYFEEHRTFFAAVYLQTLRKALTSLAVHINTADHLDEPVMIREVLRPDHDQECVWTMGVGPHGWLMLSTNVGIDVEASLCLEFSEFVAKERKVLFLADITWPKYAEEPIIKFDWRDSSLKTTFAKGTDSLSFEEQTDLLVDAMNTWCEAQENSSKK